MTTTTEAVDYESTIVALADLVALADDMRARVEAMTASLGDALGKDEESLGKIMAVEDGVEAVAASAKAARDTFVSRHETMNEAVSAAPYAAPTAFYGG
jgi:hypothetical protein